MRSIWHHPTTLLKQLIKRNVPAARHTPLPERNLLIRSYFGTRLKWAELLFSVGS